jgi:hypothetical protein
MRVAMLSRSVADVSPKAARAVPRFHQGDGADLRGELAALIPPQALVKANAELSKSGVPIDLAQLKPEQLEALVEHLEDLTKEVDHPNAKVRVFCE